MKCANSWIVQTVINYGMNLDCGWICMCGCGCSPVTMNNRWVAGQWKNLCQFSYSLSQEMRQNTTRKNQHNEKQDISCSLPEVEEITVT